MCTDLAGLTGWLAGLSRLKMHFFNDSDSEFLRTKIAQICLMGCHDNYKLINDKTKLVMLTT